IIAIVGVLVTAGGFGVNAFVQAARMRDAVTTVQVQTSEARRLAKRVDRPVEVSLEETDGAWALVVDGRAFNMPGVSVTSGETSLELDPPYGTFAGSDRVISLALGNRTAEVTITGVLARTVVNR